MDSLTSGLVQTALPIPWLVLAVVLGSLLLAAPVVWLTTRSARQSLHRLEAAAERMIQGDLSQPVDLDGARELRLLAQRIEEMRLRFVGDAKEHERTEGALRESERRLRMILDGIDVGVLLMGPGGEFLISNRASQRLFGRTADQLEGKTIVTAGYRAIRLDGSDFPQEERAVSRAVATRMPVRNVMSGIRHSDGRGDVWILANADPVLDQDGNVQQVFLTITDITEQKNAQDEIQRLNAELEQRVVERTAQLEASNHELESFAYSVSHDLRQPLRGLDGFSQALLEDYADLLDDEGRDYLRRIRKGAQRMSDLIDGLLSLSRLTRGEMTRTSVDFSALARSIILTLQEGQPEREVSVFIADGLEASGDERMLGALLENLLRNAWKFTGKRARACIEFGALQREEGPPVYYIRDNGAGFKMDYAHKLFGAFQRLHGANEFEGTGIGLATVQRIVHRHGGKIWAEGAVDQGATFYFTLQPGPAEWSSCLAQENGMASTVAPNVTLNGAGRR